MLVEGSADFHAAAAGAARGGGGGAAGWKARPGCGSSGGRRTASRRQSWDGCRLAGSLSWTAWCESRSSCGAGAWRSRRLVVGAGHARLVRGGVVEPGGARAVAVRVLQVRQRRVRAGESAPRCEAGVSACRPRRSGEDGRACGRGCVRGRGAAVVVVWRWTGSVLESEQDVQSRAANPRWRNAVRAATDSHALRRRVLSSTRHGRC